MYPAALPDGFEAMLKVSSAGEAVFDAEPLGFGCCPALPLPLVAVGRLPFLPVPVPPASRLNAAALDLN